MSLSFGDYIAGYNNAKVYQIKFNHLLKCLMNEAKSAPNEIQAKLYWKHFNWMKKHLKEWDDIQASGKCRCGMGDISDVIDCGYEFGFECTYCR